MLKEAFSNPFTKWAIFIALIYLIFFYDFDEVYQEPPTVVKSGRQEAKVPNLRFSIEEKETTFNERIDKIEKNVKELGVSRALIEQFASPELKEILNTTDSQVIRSTLHSIPSTETVKEGNGPIAFCGDTVTVKLSGQYFTHGKTAPLPKDLTGTQTFKLGEYKLFAGLEKQLVGVREGSHVAISLPPIYAFADTRFSHPEVPQSSTIKYDAEILFVKPASFKVRKNITSYTQQKGESIPIGCGDEVTFQYIFSTLGEDVGEDTNENLTPPEGSEATFKLGDGSVPAGIEDVIMGMRLGEISNAIISRDQLFTTGKNQLKSISLTKNDAGIAGVIAIKALNGRKTSKTLQLVAPKIQDER